MLTKCTFGLFHINRVISGQILWEWNVLWRSSSYSLSYYACTRLYSNNVHWLWSPLHMTELCLLVRWLQRKTIECESMSIPGGGSPIVCISSAGTGRGRTPRGQHLSHVSNRVCCTVLRRWRMRREDLNQESRHSSRQRVAKEEAPADINPWILGRSSTIAKWCRP